MERHRIILMSEKFWPFLFTLFTIASGVVKFTQFPLSDVIVIEGGNATLVWKYYVSDKSELSLRSPIWDYSKDGSTWTEIASEAAFNSWKWTISPSCPESLKHRVEKVSNATIKIINTELNDTGKYRCRLEPISHSMLSKETTLHVTKDIDDCRPNSCMNGGTCNDLVNGFNCTCAPGWGGQNCTTNINECDSNPCKNGGTCTDLVNGFSCRCTPGYGGQNCNENINECASNPCKNGGTCTDLINGFRCRCTNGWEGPDCGRNIDDCTSNPCFNGGTCQDRVGGYTCVCASGWTGLNCATDINECASNPCQNGGNCTNLQNNYFCNCPPGYTGKKCEINIDECASRPCLNGGCCVDRVNGFRCLCVPGHVGQRCDEDINECASNPCQNGGNCTDMRNDYLCNCPPGNTGKNCEIDIGGRGCDSKVCKNGGTCIVVVNETRCVCQPGYEGKDCSQALTTTQIPASISTKSLMLVKSKVTNVTVKQTEDIKLNCSLDGDGVTWKHGNGSEITLSERIKIIDKLLVISEALPSDAGAYVCSKMTPQGKVSYQVNLRVNVTIKVFMALRILNRNFTKELKNKTTPQYKNFVDDFKEQMNIVFKNVDGYVGIEILEIFNGSVRVRFRVIVVVVVKDNKDGITVTKKRVLVTQRVVTKARTGWVEGLQVDKNPKTMELNQSPPPRPENVTLIDAFKDGAEIAWELPLNHEYYDINGYFIEYWEFSSEKKERTTTIKGQRTKISDLEAGSPYTGWVVAENENGIRGEESAKIEITTKGTKEMPTWLLAIIILACIIILIAVIAIIIVYCRRKKASVNEKFDDLDMKAIQEKGANAHPKSYVNTVFSIDEKCPSFAREDLILKEELGSGEFGVVFKGQLLEKGETKECAVKTLKNTANADDYRELRQELDIMANVGYHPNLVNLIGCCVEDEKLFVVVEFARNGSLLEYLRKARTKPEEKLEFDLNYLNRLKIALDVAKGMSHLAQKRCVHRDLAARNVLLADDFVAKVADFGLSRDIYETGEYEKTTTGKLPTRWMAIESLELRRFTMQSDVWSFGVVLWEIETKGLMPHGAISFTELLNKQKGGYRMEQPTGTPDELYRVMQMCWQANPRERPTFAQICDTLKVMLYDNQTSNGNFNQGNLEIKQGSEKQEDNTNNQTIA